MSKCLQAFLTFLALLATAPLTQLFCFHLILMHKVRHFGLTIYSTYWLLILLLIVHPLLSSFNTLAQHKSPAEDNAHLMKSFILLV